MVLSARRGDPKPPDRIRGEFVFAPGYGERRSLECFTERA
jgi:hypothetical protein